MPSYLVETYLTRGRAAAAEQAGFAQSIYIPEDEICLFVVDAPSGDAAALAARRAGLEPLRVVEAIASGRADG